VWRLCCRMLLRLLPPRAHAVVHGWPDDEGNAVETLRALSRRYRGQIYWLLSDPAYSGPPHAASELTSSRIVRVRKNSLISLPLTLTAEATFFTHGLFTAVPPPDNRLVVNLWHGDGPKLALDTHLIRSTVAVAGTALWGGQRSQRFGLPTDSVAVVGNPRVDQFSVAPRAEILERLGMNSAEHTIVWLPTYRSALAPHGRTWRDGASLVRSPTVAEIVSAITNAEGELGAQLFVKPHPLDSDAYEELGIPILRHEHLAAAGVTLYQLLGVADAIISDISSVWVDFLSLDRPIGFYAPDLEEFQSRQRLNVDEVTGLLPGPRIRTAEDARRFVSDVVTDPTQLRPSRYPAFARIGVVTGDGVAERLLDWLDEYQKGRGRNVLFGVGSRSVANSRD
jgi:CDP-glycerol glycerophosphotransferase